MTNTPQTLVFADDGSAEADRAWRWVTVQTWPGWDIELVTCTPHGGLIAAELDAAGAVAARRAVPVDLTCASYEHHVVVEDPRLALTKRVDAALVVVGQRGRGALKHLHLGSTAEYLVHHLTTPLVIAKRPAAVRTVVVATDGSADARTALEACLRMPWIESILALHVVGVQAIAGDAEPGIASAIDDAVQLVADVVPCDPVPVLVQGSPAESILDTADRVDGDLIVLGTRGLSQFRPGQWWGSTARAVVQATTSSVLVARAALHGAGRQPPS